MGKAFRALALLATMIVTSIVQAQSVEVAAAKKDGKVVVYGSVVPQAMEALHKNFEKKYDIKVEYWRGSSTAVAERAQTEWRAARPAFDVVESSLGCYGVNEKGRDLRPFYPALFGKILGPVQGKGWADHAVAHSADQHPLQYRIG